MRLETVNVDGKPLSV